MSSARLASLAERLGALLFDPGGLPGWVCVGHPDPPSLIKVTLETAAGSTDVTRNHAIVCMNPLTVAIAGEWLNGHAAGTSAARLIFSERSEGAADLGRVQTRFDRRVKAGNSDVYLFRSEGSSDPCARFLVRQANYARERWNMFRDSNPRNIRMAPGDLFSMWVLYHLPRPVFLISYGGTIRANMFPMDLAGTLDGGLFALGLHADSPAMDVWTQCKQVAVTTVPLRWKPVVYRMGANHREAFRDPSTLPLRCEPSQMFGIPVPEDGLCVRELAIESSVNLGSHVFFVGRISSVDARAAEPQMCHVHRFYQRHLMREHRPLPAM